MLKTNALWKAPLWREEAGVWIQDTLNQQGRRITGPIEQTHVRPWSVVLRVPATTGDIYFKACTQSLAHEAALTQALFRWRPSDLPEVLAADPERGWLLLADGGAQLRQTLKTSQDISHWQKVLPQYAELQIDLAGRNRELLAIGVPDRRPATLAAKYGRLLADPAVLGLGQPAGLYTRDVQRLIELGPGVSSLAERLAARPLLESLHHGDFHDANIFFSEGRYVLFDWGDASIAHPFFSLRTVFVSLEKTLHVEEGAAESKRLLEAYLEPWTQVATRQELLVIYDLARRLSPLCSALSWQRSLAGVEGPERKAYSTAIPSLLKEFLAREAEAGDS